MKISIIVPVFNTAHYLKECLDSIVKQTLKDVEIILINDGSTDNSGEICDKYSSRYPNANVVHTENRGLAAARNLGVDHSSGEYILFVDSDDSIEPNACEILYNEAKSYNADLIRFFYRENTKTGHRDVPGQSSLPEGLVTSDFDKLRTAYKSGAMVWKFLIKRDLIIDNNIQFPRGRLYEDLGVTAKLALLANKMFVLHKLLYNYRLRKSSLSWTVHSRLCSDCEFCCDEGIDFAKKNSISQEGVDFLMNLKSKMINILEDRQNSTIRNEYFKECFYD